MAKTNAPEAAAMRVRTPEQQFIDALCCDIAVIAAFAFLAGVGSAVAGGDYLRRMAMSEDELDTGAVAVDVDRRCGGTALPRPTAAMLRRLYSATKHRHLGRD
ncbi:hypothetical protein EBA12_08755 [Xanthomonas oryzae pv. oryzae]|nr:hypothetical protein EBA12_08755 [Xanthomonas oryzae pv. oryzae]